MAEKKFEKLLKKMMEAPPPGYEFRPKLVPVDQNDNNKAATTASS